MKPAKINFEKMKQYMIKEISSCKDIEEMAIAYRKMANAFTTFIELNKEEKDCNDKKD
jgi:hypothetical protein